MAKYHQPAKLASPFSNRNGRAGRASSSRTWPHHDSGPCCQVPSAARNSSTNRVSAASAAAAAAPATSRPGHQKDHERANSIGKISKRVALNGDGPTYVSRDTGQPKGPGSRSALSRSAHKDRLPNRSRNRTGRGGETSCVVVRASLTCGFWVELRGFEPLTPSMRIRICRSNELPRAAPVSSKLLVRRLF